MTNFQMYVYRYNRFVSIETDASLPLSQLGYVTNLDDVNLSDLNKYMEMCDWDCTLVITRDIIVNCDVVIPSKVKLLLYYYFELIIKDLYYLDDITVISCHSRDYNLNFPKVTAASLILNNNEIRFCKNISLDRKEIKNI